ncbi:MAG: phosphoglycerate mutase [Anaerolineales bacterium]|nr:MAG: phosphoglycerate mutase [Anaerolineales bacterium]
MTLIYLIRHGHNDYVGKGKLAGRLKGVHLSEQGHAQAQALAEQLSQVKFAALYASPLERALETAKPVAAVQGLETIARPGLTEVGYGTWEGHSLKTLRRRRLWPVIQSTPSLARFPEGESFPETQARIVAEIEALRSKHRSPKARIACVFHSDPIKLAIAHYAGIPLDLFQRIVIEPASVSILAIDGQHVHIVRLNDTTATRGCTPG